MAVLPLYLEIRSREARWGGRVSVHRAEKRKPSKYEGFGGCTRGNFSG